MEAIVKKTGELVDVDCVEANSFSLDKIYYSRKSGKYYSETELELKPIIIRDKGMMVYEIARDLLNWNLRNRSGETLQEIIGNCTSLAKKFVEKLDLNNHEDRIR